MLSRHFIRAKVLQQLYACIVSKQTDIAIAEQELLEGIEQTYKLEVYIYSAVLEIRDIAENQLEEAKTKFFPTEEDLNPNMRFVENTLLVQLRDNAELSKAVEKLKINWVEQKDMLKNILNRFKESNSYKTYMEKEKCSYEDDKKVVLQLMRNYLLKNESFLEFLFEKQLYWESDFSFVGLTFLNYLKEYKSEDSKTKPLFQMFDIEKDDRKSFAIDLLTKSLVHFDEYDEMFHKHVENWDMDRLAFLDRIIIKIGMTELIYCPTIPVRVTMNEYIELAKEFSTERSKLFVNGLLDKFLIDLRAEGKINKEDVDQEEEEE
ncbi:MAG: transcription antitermination factor NusB [Bacteroidales bacterium]|nr:transcription antitermination factor NusB [Bacteroidales bacterium]